MKKNSITNKITPCCSLPFSVVYWWVSNLTLNSEADRSFVLSKINQNGTIAIDGWKVLINSGTLEADASLTKSEFLNWFNCKSQPNCEQLKIIIESLKVGNYNPIDEYGVGWTEQTAYENHDGKVIKKITGYIGGVGDLPTELQQRIGFYFGENGEMVSDKNLAIDFKDYNGEILELGAMVFPLENEEKFLFNNSLYVVKEGEELLNGETPLTNPEKVNEIIPSVVRDFKDYKTQNWEQANFLNRVTNDEAYFNTSYGFSFKQGYAVATVWNSEIPQNFDKIRIDGDFSKGGADCVTVFGTREPGVYDKIKEGVITAKSIEFDINRERHDVYLISFLKSNFKMYYGGNIIDKDLPVKEYIDKVSKISEATKGNIIAPKNLVKINFETSDKLPEAKGVSVQGVFTYEDFAGTTFQKFGTLEVQGSSSAVFPKKNWTFAFYNDVLLTSSFKLRIGKWVEHSEFVFKSNWIDATHCRNIVSNKIWEDIVQSRTYYPKRENEKLFSQITNNNVNERFDSGALCHVDGFPSEMYVNGEFYGIGMFSIGKKRENYDLDNSNQNHIQLTAEVHVNMENYVSSDWEIRSPKTPDGNFLTKINSWFNSNALTGANFKNNFQNNHNLKNAIDYFLLVEFLMANDAFDKNFILTSWDGIKFNFLPYDLDTTFGLRYDGVAFEDAAQTIRNIPFWQKFYQAYTIEIKQRYAELKAKNILTSDNVYKHFSELTKVFGRNKFKQEFTKWWAMPSNSIIYTSLPQVMLWIKDRVIWLNSQYD